MQIQFGYDAAQAKKGVQAGVVWDSQKLINGHVLIVGKSGTGKTHTLRAMLRQLQDGGGGRVRIHVIDAHGDVDIEGASAVKFSESTQYGLNPLEINPDPDFGGVRKRVQSFLAALNRTSRQLGTRQEACLRSLLQDLYAANGFLEGKPETWGLGGDVRGRAKKHPTLEDAAKFAQFKLKALFLGANTQSVMALEGVSKKMQSLQAKTKAFHKAGADADIERLRNEIAKLGQDACSLFQEHVESMQSGREFNDLIRYDNKETLKSVVERIENLNAIGVFKPAKPPFDPSNPVWRYDIRALSTDEKRLFVSFLLERLFHDATQKGVCSDVRDVIVLDEAHLYIDEDPENPINAIAKEGRKFGLGLFCASQSPTHFSDDFVSNVGAKIILGLDEMFWEGTMRKMRLERAALEWIVPHRTLIAQLNNRGDPRSKFTWVLLPQAAKRAA